MNLEVQLFEKDGFGSIRVFEKEGKVWFVGRDIAESLGYKNSNDALLKHVDIEDKEVAKCDTLGGPQDMLIINESGLYSLILSSKLSSAKKFKWWVTSEVLPSIKKHGAYLMPKKIDEILLDPDLIIDLATKLKEERELSRKQEQIIGELKPKADYVDRILKNKGLVTITQIAKDYGMSGQKMNEILHSLGVQYKQSGQWLLYREHHGKGYTHSETIDILRSDGTLNIKMNTKWTQKGRLFLYELLKENYVYPVIEKVVV